MKSINRKRSALTLRSLLLAGLVSLFIQFSCTREPGSDPTDPPVYDGNNLSLDTRSVPVDISNNARVYTFTGNGNNNTLGNYDGQITSITRSINDLRMQVKVGTWDVALVTAPTASAAGLNSLTPPTAGASGGTSAMFTLAPSGGNLPSAPELMTAYVDEQTIVADGNHTASTSFARNVAMVRLVIKEAKGLDISQRHTLSLNNVATTLSWEGKLLPSRTSPTVSATAMTGTVGVTTLPSGIQQSDTLTFLVPAHRGSDFLSSTPADTTTRKMSVSVSLPLISGGNYVNTNVEIPYTPKANKILLVNLLVKGLIEVESSILDWNEVNVNANLGTTTLQVSKTNVGFSSKDTLIVKTNASSGYTYVQQANTPWLTIAKNGEQLIFTAVTATTGTNAYTAPRTAYVDITANNITKRINVTQRPDVGTITVSQSPIWMSPSTGNTTRTVTVNSTGPWTMVGGTTLANATLSATSGNAGNTGVTFTRKHNPLDNGDYSMYGPQTWTIRNSNTLEELSVVVDNYFIYPTDVYITPPRAHADTTVTGSGIEIYGYNESFTVVAGSAPSWVLSATPGAPGSGEITVRAQREPQDEYREGYITIAHGGDPTYRVQIKLIQDVLVLIPPFDFFVIKYTWINDDVDIDVRFAGNGAPFDGQGLGYSNGPNPVPYPPVRVTSVSYKSQTLLRWGGDARGGQGETVFFNAPLLENDNALPRHIKLDCRALWWSTGRSGSPVRTTIFAYKGGTMVQNGTNFDNVGGTQLYTNTIQQRVASVNTATYIKLIEITYDRVKHSAQISWMGTELNTPLIPTPTRSMPYVGPTAGEQSAEAKEAEVLRAAANNK